MVVPRPVIVNVVACRKMQYFVGQRPVLSRSTKHNDPVHPTLPALDAETSLTRG